ncbi:MAG: M14 family metallopeptidase, partial [Acidobacteriota bacterium]
LSRDRLFTPAAAHTANKPVILVQNGIHAGEIDGKEASLALARDIVINRSQAELIEKAILLIIPIYNVDGHERFGRYNRINQNGPMEMGWRTTAQNYNLNRDYMKADAPETRALLTLFNTWLPDLYIDTHVTDGADFQYDMLYTIESKGYVATEIAKYVEETLQPQLQPALAANGHITQSYFGLRDPADPTRGLESSPFTPRFSNGFGALHNRPTVLVETHMFKTFRERIKATYDLIAETLRIINRNPVALKSAIAAADRVTSEIGNNYDSTRRLPLRFALTEKSRTVLYRGKEYRLQTSEISGAVRIIYGNAAKDMEVPFYDEPKETLSATPPLAYLLPSGWTEVITRLRAHGLRIERLIEPISGQFETYRFKDVRWMTEPFEGHHTVTYTAMPTVEQRSFPAGSILVRLDHPTAKIAFHLLEPNAPDSLLRWGFFNAIFEQKEYAEDYVLEQMAAEMLEKDPALKKEFLERLRTDATFRGSADARLNFFYQRSPYWDERKNAYPIVRVTNRLTVKTAAFE